MVAVVAKFSSMKISISFGLFALIFPADRPSMKPGNPTTANETIHSNLSTRDVDNHGVSHNDDELVSNSWTSTKTADGISL